MKRYQIFISSTYNDLYLERQAVLESVLKLRHIPVGMEYFVAANGEQFNYIKRLIDDTDYYIVIIGNRYGTQAEDGISFTEKEFDYATSLGIPIIACVHSDPNSISCEKSDSDEDSKQKLIAFRDKVMHHRMVSYFSWENPSMLSAEIAVALINLINDCPRPGWERVTSYENSDLLNQINDLRIENENMKTQIKLNNQIEEQAEKVKKVNWDDIYSFEGYSDWNDYKDCTIPVSLTRTQLFSILAPILLVKRSIKSVHTALNYTIFLEREPYFGVPNIDFDLIIADFLGYGIIDVYDDKVFLTQTGKDCFFEKRVSVDTLLKNIHSKVKSVVKNNSNNSKGKINKYIDLLSNFNSNPESINYIGQSLLSLSVFLREQTDWEKKSVDNAQTEIESILKEVGECERITMGAFDPIFNLSKIKNLIDFLYSKLNNE